MCDNSQKPFLLESGQGRIHLVLRARWQGDDLAVTLAGGKTHIGAVALASAQKADMLELAGHHEGAIAKYMASTLARRLGCVVAVTCGIHYDDITREEIDFVIRQADIFAQALLCSINRRSHAEH